MGVGTSGCPACRCLMRSSVAFCLFGVRRILDQQFESLGCDLKIKTIRHIRGIGRACVDDSFLLLPKLLLLLDDLIAGRRAHGCTTPRPRRLRRRGLERRRTARNRLHPQSVCFLRQRTVRQPDVEQVVQPVVGHLLGRTPSVVPVKRDAGFPSPWSRRRISVCSPSRIPGPRALAVGLQVEVHGGLFKRGLRRQDRASVIVRFRTNPHVLPLLKGHLLPPFLLLLVAAQFIQLLAHFLCGVHLAVARRQRTAWRDLVPRSGVYAGRVLAHVCGQIPARRTDAALDLDLQELAVFQELGRDARIARVFACGGGAVPPCARGTLRASPSEYPLPVPMCALGSQKRLKWLWSLVASLAEPSQIA